MVQLIVKFSSNCLTKFVACKYFKSGLQPRANCVLQGIMFLPEQELLSLLIIILILFTKILI